MNVDELLDALKPYAVDLQWSESADVWQVTLLDWAFLYVQHADKREALQVAYDRVRAQIAQEAE